MSDYSLGQPSKARVRVNYVDWLRILAVLLLIPFHSARLFDFIDDFYVKNAETDFILTVFVAFLGSWHMPLLFVLAGAATWFALGFRGPGRYLGERLVRLALPLIVGVLVVVPPQMYFAQLFRGGNPGSYLDYYPTFFQLVWGPDYPGLGFSYAHLWFILFLFFISLAALPLFILLRSEGGSLARDALAKFFARPRAILLLALPLPFTTLAEDPLSHNATLYFFLFVYGFLLMSDARYQAALLAGRRLAAVLGLLCTLAYFALALGTGTTGDGVSVPAVLFNMAFYTAAWFWAVAALGYGRQYLKAENALLRYANEAAYPFYILHQTVIVIIGYYIVAWPLPLWPKYLLLVLLSLAGTLAIYDLVVRRIGVLRFLFGMKAPRREKAQLRQA